jgi:hypothetical protein
VKALFAAAILLLLAVAVFFSCFTHKCSRGHYETVHVGDYTIATVMNTGNGVVVPIVNHIPAHDERQWVCKCGGFGIAR